MQPYIETFTGKIFHFLDPQPDEIDLVDIAHALSQQCRYTGHCKQFYSVAEHSVLVAALVKHKGGDSKQQLQGLLHDATEAYLTDVASPVKPFLGDYKPMESVLWRAIAEVFAVPFEFDPLVRWADQAALLLEAAVLLPSGGKDWKERKEFVGELPNMGRILCLQPTLARHAFLKTFDNLAGTGVVPSIITPDRSKKIIVPEEKIVEGVVNG